MKKQILIVSGSMELGGIERSLLGLLDAVDYDKYDIDLHLHSHSGELMPLINKKVRVLPEIPQCASMTKPIKSVLLSSHPLCGAARLAAKPRAKKLYMASGKSKDALTFATLSEYWRSCVRLMPKIKKHYDAAVSFMWPHDFVAAKVSADKKIAFIHTDYSSAAMDFEHDISVWSKFDAIAAVSDECGAAFSKVYPMLEKPVTIENILSPEAVRRQSELFEPKEYEDNCFKVLSVGRFCRPKAFELAVRSCAIAREKGLNLKWYVIGFGPDEELIRSAIAENQLEDSFIILGKMANPYPYMRACNLYCQPSRYEGKAVTVREAQILGKPVLITNYATASSQVKSGVDGFICPMGVENVAEAIKMLAENGRLREELTRNCLAGDFSNSEYINRLYDFIEGKGEFSN